METRDKIILSAVELFEKKGYHTTTIQEISENAGVSKGAVFHYFPNKTEILFVIHERFIDVLLVKANHVLQKADLNAAQKLQQLIIDLVQLIADFKPYVVVFFQEYKYIGEDKMAIIKAKREHCEKIFQSVVEAGVADGEFRKDLEVDIIVKAIFGMCDWTHQWMNPAGKLKPGEIGLIFWEILMGGVNLFK
ncbi:transcriptional regulator, TetR family [Desulfotomaculum arcticum]|uniref:Transcriptional regulator, TetR family n=1 Tax=Desulfotruncus arcticus DSM 17038 TaxID=1121424 RepID=A0A1I2N2H1_9FIRM|nr:TetR/AcrR family transcriptional regulator [Desulfotruncus arcticus]SFF97843.1 transcriptional regulator, TetR family [Desulfotomaculum arcticum] [Desulfotruncus arcticus DSM 17038]